MREWSFLSREQKNSKNNRMSKDCWKTLSHYEKYCKTGFCCCWRSTHTHTYLKALVKVVFFGCFFGNKKIWYPCIISTTELYFSFCFRGTFPLGKELEDFAFNLSVRHLKPYFATLLKVNWQLFWAAKTRVKLNFTLKYWNFGKVPTFLVTHFVKPLWSWLLLVAETDTQQKKQKLIHINNSSNTHTKIPQTNYSITVVVVVVISWSYFFVFHRKDFFVWWLIESFMDRRNCLLNISNTN